MRLQLDDKLLALPAIIRLGWKRLAVTSNLAYFKMELIMSVNFVISGS
jgi:hypothetical protein